MGRPKAGAYQNDSDDGPDYSPEKPAMTGKGKERGQAMPQPPFFPAGRAGPSTFPTSPMVFNTYYPPGNAHNAWAQVQVPHGQQVGGQYYAQPTRSMPEKSRPDPYKALEVCQLELAKKEEEMKELRKLLAALQVDQSNAEPPAGRKKKKAEEASQSSSKPSAFEFEKRVGDLARQCSLMQLLFIQAGHFMQSRPMVIPIGGTIKDATPIALDDPRAFRTAENRAKRTTAVIYDITPDDLKRDFRKNPKFRESFTRQFHNARRSSIHKFREDIAPKIWKHDAEMFAADADRSNYKPFLKRLYENPDAEDKEFSTKAPLFYPDKYMEPEDMFKTHELAMVMRGLLFGPSAIRAPHAKPAHGTVGRNWGIKCVTPGLIAFAATISVYGHSNDERLEGKGSETGINYDHLFNKIIKIILTKLEERVTVATALFKFHNRIVFAGLVISVKGIGAAGSNGQGDTSDSSGIEDMLGPHDVEAYEEEVKGLGTDHGADLSDSEPEAQLDPPTPGPQHLEKRGKDYDPTTTSEGTNSPRRTKHAKKKKGGQNPKAVVDAGEGSNSADEDEDEERSGLPPTPPRAGKNTAIAKSAKPKPLPRAIQKKPLADHNDGDDESSEGEYPAVPATPMKKGAKTNYIPKSRLGSKAESRVQADGSDDIQDDNDNNGNDDSDQNDNDEDDGDLDKKKQHTDRPKKSKPSSNQRSRAKAAAPAKSKGRALKTVEEAGSNEEDEGDTKGDDLQEESPVVENVAGGSGKHKRKAQAVALTITVDEGKDFTKKVVPGGKASKSAGSKNIRGIRKNKPEELEAPNELEVLGGAEVSEVPLEEVAKDKKKKKKKAGGRNAKPDAQQGDTEQPPQILTIRLPPVKGAKSAQKKGTAPPIAPGAEALLKRKSPRNHS